jgi:hypothetical protein
MSPSKKPQTPIRIPPDIRARLDAEAARLELSINAIIILLLDRHLPPLPGAGAPEPAPAPEPADDANDLLDF